MATNRLKLDFTLSTTEERRNFLNTYLLGKTFLEQPPTEDELSTMADYLLWGKDPITGKNGKQEGLELKTKHGTWDNKSIDSLDQLMEQPTFNEAALSTLGSTQFRVRKEIFSREEALAECPETIRPYFLILFQEIDKLDLSIQLYELYHGKRTKEIRPDLLKQFSQEEIDNLNEKITHWNQYKYLKKRHQLVEMRREQYTLRDSYKKIMFSAPTEQFEEAQTIDFDVEIEVLPLGVKHKENDAAHLIFRAWPELLPSILTSEQDAKLVSDLYWSKHDFSPKESTLWFDFRELEHVYNLLDQESTLRDLAPEQEVDSNLQWLLETLWFYIEQADLTDVQREILDRKVRKEKNVDIAREINGKYNKSYTPNYISTIFRQRIIPRINDAARYHEKVVASLFFPEDFKTCAKCGETMLRCSDNFTRKSRSNDGFSARCKRCEKKARQGE